MRSLLFGIILLFSSLPAVCFADQYYSVPLNTLKIIEGSLPVSDPLSSCFLKNLPKFNATKPYAVLDGKGEGYVACRGNSSTFYKPFCNTEEQLVIRAEGASDIHGSLFVRDGKCNGLVKLKFEITSPKSTPTSELEYQNGRRDYFNDLINRNVPGAAWFRYLASKVSAPTAALNTNLNSQFIPRQQLFDDTFALFSGGKAVSESLQLDRRLPQTTAELQPTIDLSTLEGITVKPYDWTTLIKGINPKLDPLAPLIPADQYALFFPSFGALTSVLDEADLNSSPLLAAFEHRSEDAMTKERYQHQLCLPRDALSEMVGPLLIQEIAITGSDPYLRSGSDLTVIFKTKTPDLLKEFVLTKQRAAISLSSTNQKVEGAIEGVTYNGAISKDRTLSSYLAVSDSSVIVSNSLNALGQILRTSKKPEGSYQNLSEYKFFRSQYTRGDSSESAMLLVSDDAIRKWCGPLWRIATSRRVRAEAFLADLEAEHLMEIVGATGSEKEFKPTNIPMELGKLTISNRGVRSEVYGSRDFLTPISELSITKVSSAESQGYVRWRDGYQKNWSNFFDPLAVRLTVKPDSVEADLSIMPLINESSYRTFINLSEGVKLPPTAGDPHAHSLFHFSLALNNKSTLMHQGAGFAQSIVPSLTDPFSWIGNFVSVYADPDPFWQELASQKDQGEYLQSKYSRLPIALQVGVTDILKATLFLTALRGGMGQSAPGMMVWENFDYKGTPYVKVSPTASPLGAQSPQSETPVIYYAITPTVLTVTFNEELLKRSLDRRKAVEKDPSVTKGLEWLGDSMAGRISHNFTNTIEPTLWNSTGSLMQISAWSNIPILNEWKRLFPDQDPLEVHKRYWHTALTTPGGGNYVWNNEWHTMESTIFGHPGEPKSPKDMTSLLSGFNAGEFGLSFVNDGLETKVKLERVKK